MRNYFDRWAGMCRGGDGGDGGGGGDSGGAADYGDYGFSGGGSDADYGVGGTDSGSGSDNNYGGPAEGESESNDAFGAGVGFGAFSGMEGPGPGMGGAGPSHGAMSASDLDTDEEFDARQSSIADAFQGPSQGSFWSDFKANLSNPGKYMDSRLGQAADSFKNNPVGFGLDTAAMLGSLFTGGLTGVIASGINGANTVGSMAGVGTIGDALGNIGGPSSPNTSAGPSVAGNGEGPFSGQQGPGDDSDWGNSPVSDVSIASNPILSGTGAGMVEGPPMPARGARTPTPLASPLTRPGGIENLDTLGVGNYYNPNRQPSIADLIRVLRLS